MSDFLTTFGKHLKNNVPSFIATAVVEMKTGISYYSLSVNSSFDPDIASVFNLKVTKSKLKAIKALGLNDKIEYILITLSTQIHIIDIAENGEYMIYLAVRSDIANLGMTRAMLNRYKKDIASKL